MQSEIKALVIKVSLFTVGACNGDAQNGPRHLVSLVSFPLSPLWQSHFKSVNKWRDTFLSLQPGVLSLSPVGI